MPSAPLDQPGDDFWADPRSGALIEQAEACQLAGDHQGALALLDEAVAIPGIDAGYAMATRASSLFTLGRDADARSQLNELRKHQPFSAMAFHQAAEVAALHGDPKLALRWFDMGLSRLTDLLADGWPEFDLGPQVAMLVIGRSRVRTSLGLPPDGLDRSAMPQPQVARPGRLPPGAATSDTVVRILFWPRDQISQAASRWPGVVQHTDDEAVVRERELENRLIVARDGARIVMVPITVGELEEFATRTGGDPHDGMTRTKLLHEKFDQGLGIPWPPMRNDVCWCGSGGKYKRCCGQIQ